MQFGQASEDGRYNETQISNSKNQLILFLYSFRKYMRWPLIALNSFFILMELLFGFGFIATLLTFGLLLVTGVLDKQDDLKSYYSFWQYVWPNSMYESMSKNQALTHFYQNSYFDLQRLLTALLLIISAGLMMAENSNGSILGVLTISYYALIHVQPWIKDDQSSLQQSWLLIMKHLAAIGGVLMIMTRGKCQREGETVRVHLPSLGKPDIHYENQRMYQQKIKHR
eukprot:403341080